MKITEEKLPQTSISLSPSGSIYKAILTEYYNSNAYSAKINYRRSQLSKQRVKSSDESCRVAYIPATLRCRNAS